MVVRLVLAKLLREFNDWLTFDEHDLLGALNEGFRTFAARDRVLPYAARDEAEIVGLCACGDEGDCHSGAASERRYHPRT